MLDLDGTLHSAFPMSFFYLPKGSIYIGLFLSYQLKNFFELKYSSFTTFCFFRVYSTVIQLYIYILEVLPQEKT